MVASELSTHFRTFLRRGVFKGRFFEEKKFIAGRRRYQHRHRQPQTHGNNRNLRTSKTGFEIIRFVTFSIATLPVTSWIALYAFNYSNRISICSDALSQEDNEITSVRSKLKKSAPSIGIENQLSEVRKLFSGSPKQIIVIAGVNEAGKSRFIAECVASVPVERGVTYINLSTMSDSLSTLTHAFVMAFNLQWLHMRHSLIDMLPFAGSEILVMKERFSGRDLTGCFYVITEALQQVQSVERKKDSELPVIFVDGLGDDNGSGWIRSPEGRSTLKRIIKWCIHITKERNLAHVVLSGNEELVWNVHQSRTTRGHVRVIGLANKSVEEGRQIVLQELPDARKEEIDMIMDNFGCFLYDLMTISREIQVRLARGTGKDDICSRKQIVSTVIEERYHSLVERITAAFSKSCDPDNNTPGTDRIGDGDGDDMDPYLDPLKAVYSEAQASQDQSDDQEENESLKEIRTWTKLQLWKTIERLATSEKGTITFADLRDKVFDGNVTPILDLMNEDILGFDVGSGDNFYSWEVKPATYALGQVFKHLVDTSCLRDEFLEMQQEEEGRIKLEEIEYERKHLQRERRRLDMRKASLLKTVQLGKELKVNTDKVVDQNLKKVFFSMAEEDVAIEKRADKLRQELERVKQSTMHEDGHVTNFSSIHQKIKLAALQAYSKRNSKDRLDEAFNRLSNNQNEIRAADIVRMIKETSGEDVDMETANALIEAYDDDDNRQLSREEFVHLLLSDDPLSIDDKKRRRTSSKL